MKNLNQNSLSPFGVNTIIFLFGLFAFSDAMRPTPTASVAADKMNIFYIGIDNPITVAMAGVPSEKVQVSCENAKIKNLDNGHYNVIVNEVGNKTIKVTDGNHTQEIIYRVKRMPDPHSVFAGMRGGSIKLYRFKQQKGINVTLGAIPLKEKCEIIDYEMTRQSKGTDVISIKNKGAKFSTESQKIVNEARKGDIYYFDHIRCECPGDPGGRKINSMVFRICLLYTSPSPRDATLSRMPSSA